MKKTLAYWIYITRYEIYALPTLLWFNSGISLKCYFSCSKITENIWYPMLINFLSSGWLKFICKTLLWNMIRKLKGRTWTTWSLLGVERKPKIEFSEKAEFMEELQETENSANWMHQSFF